MLNGRSRLRHAILAAMAALCAMFGMASVAAQDAAIAGQTYRWEGTSGGDGNTYGIELRFREDGQVLRYWWGIDRNGNIFNPKLTHRAWQREGDQIVMQIRIRGGEQYANEYYDITPDGLRKTRFVVYEGSRVVNQGSDIEDAFYESAAPRGEDVLGEYYSSPYQNADPDEWQEDAYWRERVLSDPRTFVSLGN